jgi:hypothetical protein
MIEETKVFWVATPYDDDKDEVDEFLHDEIQNSILDYIEENLGIDPETVDMLELTVEEYEGFSLQPGELLFVYGPLASNKHPISQTYIPDRVSFDIMFVYETGKTIMDNEHPCGWKERTMNDKEVDELVGNL